MYRETIRADIRAQLGEDDEDFWSDEFLNRKIDEAIRRFCHEERWSWLETILDSISVPAGTTDFELIDDVDFNRHHDLAMRPTADADDSRLVILQRVSVSEGFRLRPMYTANSLPCYYYIAQTVLNEYGTPETDRALSIVVKLLPAPDQDYTAEFHYFREPAGIVDGEEPDVPEPYQGAIIAWAAGQAWLNELSGGGKAQEQYNIYQSILNQARQDQKSGAADDIMTWGGNEADAARQRNILWAPRISNTLGP